MKTDFCKPHLERTGRKVRASRVVNKEPFCEACFQGRMPGTRRAASCRPKGLDGAMVLRLCKTAKIVDVARQLRVNPSTIQYYLKRARRRK